MTITITMSRGIAVSIRICQTCPIIKTPIFKMKSGFLYIMRRIRFKMRRIRFKGYASFLQLIFNRPS